MTAVYRTDGTRLPLFTTTGQPVWDDDGPTVPADQLPPALDETAQALRPTGRIIFRATVEADGSGDYPTVSAAVAAGRNEQAARLIADRAPAPTPHYWVQIIVGPGHYADTIKPPAYTSLIGAGGDTTVIEQDGQNALGVLEFAGRAHIEGIAFLKTSPIDLWQPKYPVHNASGGTTVWADCGFYTDAVALDREVGRASGNDGVQGGTVLFYRCRFNGRADSHGWDTDVDPQTVMFVNCESTSAVGFRSGDGGAGAAADETWVAGGTVRQVNVEGPNATLHLDPNTVADTVTTGEGVATTSRTDWPVPYGALTDAERAEHGL